MNEYIGYFIGNMKTENIIRAKRMHRHIQKESQNKQQQKWKENIWN